MCWGFKGLAPVLCGPVSSCQIGLVMNFIFFLSFVDRDMTMRYHWGHAVGHIYGHSDSVLWDSSRVSSPNLPNIDLEEAVGINSTSEAAVKGSEGKILNEELARPEKAAPASDDDQDSEGWLDSDGSDGSEEDYDDADLLEFEEMYG